MRESFVSSMTVWACVLWALVGGLLLSAWIVALERSDLVAIYGMLAATGLALSAVAATVHIRVYAARICTLVRATSQGGQNLRLME